MSVEAIVKGGIKGIIIGGACLAFAPLGGYYIVIRMARCISEDIAEEHSPPANSKQENKDNFQQASAPQIKPPQLTPDVYEPQSQQAS